MTASTAQPKPLSYFMEMSLKRLFTEFRKDFILPAHKAINRAKLIIAIERKKEGKKSITAVMKDELGFADSNAFKPVRVFRDLVAVDEAGGTLGEAPDGKITEAQFNKITAITVHIAASSVLGLIDDLPKEQESERAGYIEDVAQTLATHETTEDTLKALEVLKVQLKPAPKKKDPNDPTDGAEETEEVKALKKEIADLKENGAVPLTAVGMLALFSGEQGKATFGAIVTHARTHSQEALAIGEMLQSLALNASKIAPHVLHLVPVAA